MALRSAGYSAIVARMLAARGVASAAEADAFLTPDLARDWLDPLLVCGMAEAAEAVADAVHAGRRIVVFGDFGLDGISAAALAVRGLRAMGADAAPMVPHRFREGYGLSVASLERVFELSPELVVTVDCGISSAAEAHVLRERGVSLVVTDHHEPGDEVPRGVPVADPRLHPDGAAAPSAGLAGAGVALKLVQAVGGLLGSPGEWRTLTDLATLGTVADVVPIAGENRALVADGLARMRSAPRAGIAALAQVAGIETRVMRADNLAYALAPRLNAPGRVGDPDDALALLLADDPDSAQCLAERLDADNRTRQALEAGLLEAAGEQAAQTFAPGDRALVLAGEGWHEGVKGIVASRLAAQYGVPALLFCIEDGVAKGSGRSGGAVDLHGGGAAAAGLLPRFR
ncbi:MAG: single-stranded-DNA-specific exonuclease RecJ, partial [Actinobacteria bacterium]